MPVHTMPFHVTFSNRANYCIVLYCIVLYCIVLNEWNQSFSYFTAGAGVDVSQSPHLIIAQYQDLQYNL